MVISNPDRCKNHRLYIRSGRSHQDDVTHWFVDCRFEASSSHFGRRHLGFWPSTRNLTEVTQEGGAKYNRTLNKTFLGDQNVTINFHELKTHCERVKVVRRKHGQLPDRTTPW